MRLSLGESPPEAPPSTPGVRTRGSTWDDQKRVMTPEAAMRAGADYLVIGQPIRDAADPASAAREIVAAMERGLSSPERRGRASLENPTA